MDSDDAKPVFVSKEVSSRALDWGDVIARLRSVYSVPHQPANTPKRAVARAEGVYLRAQPSAPPGATYMGAKLFGVGREKGTNYLIALFEQKSGLLAGLVDGNLVTAYRTAATSAVAIDRLTPRAPVRLAMLGSGLEARHHVEALRAIRAIESLAVFSPSVERREMFVDDMRKQFALKASAAASPQEALSGATLVLCAARATGEVPILRSEWLSSGQVVVSIGSTLPEQREIDSSVIARCDLIVCDTLDEVVHETGDMIAAAAENIPFQGKLMTLNEAMSEEGAARVARARLPLYKSVGSGLQDVVVAEVVLERAIAEGWAAPSGTHFATRRPPATQKSQR